MLKMKELPSSERPYEKLEMYGPSKLSNSELLAIIIKSGTKNENSVEIAQKILKLGKNNNDLRFLQEMSINQYQKIKGIGKVKAIQLIAVGELAKRMAKPIEYKAIQLKTTKDVADLLMPELINEKREIAKVIILNSKNVVQKIVDFSIGGTSFAAIEPKHALAEAIKMEAPKIILVHNHPSGDPTPSAADFRATDRIYEAADVMGIQLIDHVIIGDNKFESVFSKEKGRYK